MNIVQIVPRLDAGGVERGTVDIAEELSKRGHRMIVVSSGGRLVGALEKAGIKHYTLPVHEKSPWTIIANVSKLKEIIAVENIDIVHARSRVPALSAFFAVRSLQEHLQYWPTKNKFPVFVTTAHGHYSRHYFSRVMGWSRFVIAVSQAIARHMIDDFAVPEERIFLIHRGIDFTKFTFSLRKDSKEDSPVLALIGRVTPIKGHVDFIKAVLLLKNRFPKIRAWIVGSVTQDKISYFATLKELISRYRLEKNISFFEEHQDIAKVLEKTDVVVAPSTGQEAFGRVIVEAQAKGRPVVASRVGGIVDIIEDGKTGLLVPPREPAKIQEAVERLLTDRELYNSIVQHARTHAEEHFSLEAMADKTLAVYEKAVAQRSILVIKFSSFGDIVLSSPALRALRAKFPSSKICIMVSDQAQELLRYCPYVDDIITFERKRLLKDFRYTRDFFRKLRAYGFEIVFDLQNNKLSHIASFLTCATRRYGYANKKWSFFLNDTVRYIKNEVIGPVEHQFRVLSMVGIEYTPAAGALEVWLSKRYTQWAQDFLQENWMAKNQIIVGMNVGASPAWHTKRWPPEHCARLCELLAKEGIRTIFTGTDEDARLMQPLLAGSSAKPILAMGRTTLMQLAALIARCNVYVSGDSAPLHIATALGIPTIALFGPTNPKRHANPQRNVSVIAKKVPCIACYKRNCDTKKCMRLITPEEVCSAVIKNVLALA